MTLDEGLVDRVDRAARKLWTTRSGFTRKALQEAREGAPASPRLRGSARPGRGIRRLGIGAGVARLKRGEVRWYRFARPDKNRPVVILTRDSILEYLGEATIAPITRTVRGIASLWGRRTGCRSPVR